MQISHVFLGVVVAVLLGAACDPAMVFEGRIRAVPCPDESVDPSSLEDSLAPLPGIQVVKECEHGNPELDLLAVSGADGIVDVVRIGEWGSCDLVFQSPSGMYITQRYSEQELCRMQEGSNSCNFLSFDINMVPMKEQMCLNPVE